MRTLALSLLFVLLSTVAWAGTGDLTPGVTTAVFPVTSLAPGEYTTSGVISVGSADHFGFDWEFTGVPTIHVIILQSNSPDGPFTQWSGTSLAGTTITNSVTTTTAVGGTDVILSPSAYVKVQLHDTGSTTPTLTRFSFYSK